VRSVLTTDGCSGSDSALEEMIRGTRRARWSPKKWRGGGGMEEMIRGTLGPISTGKKGMVGHGSRRGRSADWGSGGPDRAWHVARWREGPGTSSPREWRGRAVVRGRGRQRSGEERLVGGPARRVGPAAERRRRERGREADRRDPLAGRGGRGCRVGPTVEREREPTDRWAWLRKSKCKTDSNLTLSKTSLPWLEKSKIKYGCEGFKEGNNFLHRNLLRFEIYFELKIWEVKV
jgi:hypothetical protein